MKPIQPSLNIQISSRTVLVGIGVMQAALGVDMDSIISRSQSGELLWVWDISAGGGSVIEYRFWSRELVAPEWCRNLKRDEVVRMVIGTDLPRIRRQEACRILACTRPHVKRLVDDGHLSADPAAPEHFIDRASFESFLKKRIL